MKPEWFIREFGVEKAREVVEGASGVDFAYDAHDQVYMRCGDIQDGFSINDYEGCFLLEDLKRLVESIDLVESWGGINDLKLYDLSHCKDKPESAGYKLLKAIAAYESIYGGGDE